MMIASASHDRTVRLWDATTGKSLHVLTGHSSAVSGLVELSDGTLLSGSFDRTIIEWDTHKGKSVSVSTMTKKVYNIVALKSGSIVLLNFGNIEVRKTWIR
eukprot:TRINITY_DN7146_c0_g1_i1.p2 TRINITY_DN7146_c0_g1~~TRINITY_DN7146_c0_g1_i1.p2  ORF type:complete len:101 (-),score=17.55 TRINITY_DN7146_c0_g1_i1:43-345(-)